MQHYYMLARVLRGSCHQFGKRVVGSIGVLLLHSGEVRDEFFSKIETPFVLTLDISRVVRYRLYSSLDNLTV